MAANGEMAFPRGKRTKSTSSESTKQVKEDKQKQAPSKKRSSPATATSTSSDTNQTTLHKENDFLFGSGDQFESSNSASSTKKKRTNKDDPYYNDQIALANKDGLISASTISQLPLGGGAVLQPTIIPSNGRRMPAKIELLSFGKLGKGMKVLGVLREVASEYAVVSLPCMLTGFVRRSGKGPPLTQVLPPVDTIMAFSILQTTTEQLSGKSQSKSSKTADTIKKRRIELSPLPNHVNAGVRLDQFLSSAYNTNSETSSNNESSMIVRGRIVSIEDHGCIVDLGGIASSVVGSGERKMQAFLKFENIEGSYEIVDEDDEMEEDDVEDQDNHKEKDADSTKTAAMEIDNNNPTRLLNKHRLYDFAISPSSNTNAGSQSILQLTLPSPQTLSTMRTTSNIKMAPSLSSLMPGMLMEVQVEQYAKNGMCLSFMKGVYRGAVDEDHLGGWRGVDEKGSGGKNSHKKLDVGGDPSMWWKNVFRGKHAKFSARIIAVDAATKIVRFSLNPHILAMRGEYAAFPHPVGTIIQNAQVIRVDPGIGALLALPTDSTSIANEEKFNHILQMDKVLSNNLMSISEYKAASKVCTAYVHISKSMDGVDDKSSKKGKQDRGKPTPKQRTPEALFARHFSINTRIKSLRILNTTNLLDGIASCATAKSIVEAHVLTHGDIVPGTIYRNVPVIQLLDGGGVLVDLGVGTKGIIPAMHLFDKASHGNPDAGGDAVLSGYRQKIRSAKYKDGSLVDVRCLTVDPVSRQCILTAKKTLLTNDIDNPIVEYTPPSLEQGRVAAGFLSRVDDTGVTVTFYNNVHGRVSSRSLAAELGVEDPRLNYTVGDVVAARVVDCERRRHKGDENDGYYYQLKLSLKTVVESTAEKAAPKEEVKSSSTGEEGSKDATGVPLAAGSLLLPKRMKVLQIVSSLGRDDGTFLPGYAVVSVKSKFFTGVSSNGDSIECKLPFDQILDSYGDNLSSPPIELDEIAQKELKVGKRVDKEGLILSVPSGGEPIISLRAALIDTIKNSSSSSDDLAIVCPSPTSNLFMGAYVQGYVTRKDERFGSFVRFLNGLTGLIPKLKKGLDENLYDTILCKVTALDITSSPPKILLKKVSESDISKKKKKIESKSKRLDGTQRQIQVGELVGDVKVADINFARAKVFMSDSSILGSNVRARIHVTMAEPIAVKPKLSKKEKQEKEEHKIGKSHPFYNWKVGDIIKDVRCVAVDSRDGVSYVELANRSEESVLNSSSPIVVSDPSQLSPGSIVSAIITSVSSASTHHGLWVQVCPGISGFIPALELSMDPDVLNDIQSNYKVGTRLSCCVMEKTHPKKMPVHHRLQRDDHDDNTKEHQALELSALLISKDHSKSKQPVFKSTKPQRGEVTVGRINKKMRMQGPPSLMLNLRGGFAGRCCITELSDIDDWVNMPLGKAPSSGDAKIEGDVHKRVVSDSDADHSHDNDDADASDNDEESNSDDARNDYPDGKYVKCRVLGSAKSKATVDLSLRDARLEGDLEDDYIPEPNEMTHAYVVSTTKKGCFVRLSRSVEGRVILKELSDDFIPDPTAMFPPGRLVVGKVKNVTKSDAKKKGNNGLTATVDIDMRESVLLSSGDRLTIDDIQENSKYTGVISRVESYGVFIRIDNSDVSGLAHVSECSDTYVKNIFDLYNPGDLVKVLVIKMDKEQRRLGFSLKPSNFVDDDDSDDESASGVESSSEESDGEEGKDAMNDSSDDEDSDDENFVTKMAAKMKKSGDNEMDVDGSDEEESTNSSSGSDDDSDSDEESDDEKPEKSLPQSMDTNVGFDWGSTSKPSKSDKLAESSDDDSTDSSSDSSDDDSDDADTGFKSSHKARKRAAAKRREEEEISRREVALADGTADENPETAADFERLVASSPNSSEIWIKYMAFHLSLADMDSARNVANRAFDRIEFRQEGEKLNVWSALLTLELKYGNDKSLQPTIDRACQHNNPKQVYLRICELLDKEVEAASVSSTIGSSDLDTATKRADDMFAKMCKKFKSKKTVWIAHFNYLLKGARHEEAHALLKRSLQSLAAYKHVETMSKFAQMEFELGSPERGRTIFNALLEKHPKRMDLLFVNIDKEVKNGDIDKARALFDSVVNPVSDGRKQKFKFSDKQMKSLFKKWYRMEEEHGDDVSQERVKEEARAFVGKSKSN